MTISLLTTNPDATDPQWLDQLGQISNWKHSATCPGGATQASFNFIAPVDFVHPAVRAGRIISAYSGTSLVWKGVLDSPERGDSWSCAAKGLAALAKNYGAINTSNSNGILDILGLLQTFVLGTGNSMAAYEKLPWQAPVGPYTAIATPATAPVAYTKTVDDVLGILVSQGGYWSLTADGTFATPPGPTAVTSTDRGQGTSGIVYANSTPGARSMDNFAEYIAGIFYNSASYNMLNPQASTFTATLANVQIAAALRGKKDELMDLTSLGPITQAAAVAYGTSYLTSKYGNGPAFTGTLQVGRGDFTTYMGAHIDLATFWPGGTVRVFTVNPDTWASEISTFDIAIGQVDYDDVSGYVTLTPMTSVLQDYISVIARALS